MSLHLENGKYDFDEIATLISKTEDKYVVHHSFVYFMDDENERDHIPN